MNRRSVQTRGTIFAEEPSRWEMVTTAAFVLAVVIVIARMSSLEILRDPWDAVPGGQATLRTAGPGVSLVLDLLAIIPALLVLARRVGDSNFRIVFRWSYVPMALLGVWTLLSVLWAVDRFAALVSGAQFVSGLILLWAVSQAVRRWWKLRVVAAVCFGLLLLLMAKSVVYKAIDVPANRAYWLQTRDEFLKERGWQPDSFHAIQFENKLLSGELVGFYSSANTMAAVAVFLMAVSCGIGVQKLKDGESAGWLSVPVVSVAVGVWMLIEARSKAAGAAPVLGAGIFAVVWFFRAALRRRPVLFYWIGVGLTAGAVMAVVGIGLHEHGLFQGHFSNSLDFRWKYWTAAMGVLGEHLIIGVGWNNFGMYYLAHRLAEAAEEIQDPHNFLVRFFVELGLVGGALVVVWLMRLAWEMTRPGGEEKGERAVERAGLVTAAACGGMLLSILVNVDFGEIGAAIALELLRDFLFLMLLLLGMLAGVMLSARKKEMDARPAPWIFYCMLIALGLMLVQNLIDFSFFEAGPMYLFFLVAGSVLGLSRHDETNRAGQMRAGVMLGIGCACWLASAGFVAQVIAAEQSAYDASEDIRTAPGDDPGMARAHFLRAAGEFRAALDHVPLNADYAQRCSMALFSAGEISQAQQMISRAIRINPRLVDAYLLQANLELHVTNPDAALVQKDFDEIFRLNPSDVSLHIKDAQALEKFGLWDKARKQFELAIHFNDLLPAEEPKRLSAEEISGLNAEIARCQRMR